nr:anthranilate phosphoribosyltransferase [Ameyamaea chiangmaiensis]
MARGDVLDAASAARLFGRIMDGDISDIGIAAFLMALRTRGETSAELAGAVRAMRDRMIGLSDVPADTVDVCGTGGDGLGTLNVSTAVAFVLASMGVPVAKHGNRSQSSRSGATDVVAALGVGMPDDPLVLSRLLRDTGLVFLAAPNHHPAMRHAAPVRRGLGIRTLFNLVGPLSNPAAVRRQLIGVYDVAWLMPVVETARDLGATCVWAVHGETARGGTDELTLAGDNHVVGLDDGQIRTFTVTAEMAGLPSAPIEAIVGGDPRHNAQALEALLGGATGPYRDTVVLNAAVALHVAGRGGILDEGRIAPAALRDNVTRVGTALASGQALQVLRTLREASSSQLLAAMNTGTA